MEENKMTFGRYIGKPMEDVPAKYLLWLNEKGTALSRRRYYSVYLYIKENLQELKEEILLKKYKNQTE